MEVTWTDKIFEDIVETIREPLLVLDSNLKVILANQSFYDSFKVKPEDTVGQLIYDRGNKEWDIPKLRELLETILPEKTSFDNYEVEHDFATIGRRIMLLNARQIQRVSGKERIILLAIEDITERRRMEGEREILILKLQKALAEVKTLKGIFPICASCKKIRDDEGYWNQIEAYISKRSDAEFSHGICPECAKELYPDFDLYPEKK